MSRSLFLIILILLVMKSYSKSIKGYYTDLPVDKTQLNQYEVITDSNGNPIQLINTITIYTYYISIHFHSYDHIMIFSLKKSNITEDAYIVQTEYNGLYIWNYYFAKNIFYCNQPFYYFTSINLNKTQCIGYDASFMTFKNYKFEDQYIIHMSLDDQDRLIINDFRHPRYLPWWKTIDFTFILQNPIGFVLINTLIGILPYLLWKLKLFFK